MSAEDPLGFDIPSLTDFDQVDEEAFRMKMDLLNHVALSQMDGQTMEIGVGTQTLDVVVASTMGSRIRGLSSYVELPHDGMIFIYAEDHSAHFTRDPMSFDIAIWFFDSEGQMFDFDRGSPVVTASAPYRYVLETSPEVDLHGSLRLKV